jgi:RNA polymerase sigma-70 factor, ECF subfamily
MIMIPESSLLEHAHRFEEDALAEIYDRYSPGIYRYAMRLLGDVTVAEDCVADTFSRFLVALRNRQGPREHLQAYLYRVAHNWITDHYRRQPPPSLPLETEADVIPDPAQDPARATQERWEQQQVRSALLLLTPEQRQVIMLKFYEDLSNEEAAAALEKPVGAIKALQHRALEALRRLLVRPEVA